MINPRLKSLSIIALACSILTTVPLSTIGQPTDDAIVLIVNLERIRAQLLQTQRSFDLGGIDSAFAHAFIPHTTIFPSIKEKLKSIDQESSLKLESLLTDLPIKIKTGGQTTEDLGQDFVRINDLLDAISIKVNPDASADKSVLSHTVVFLLRDAVQSYQLSNAGSNKVDYENAIVLVDVANQKYQVLSPLLDEARKLELDSFFADLKSSIAEKSSNENVARLATAIEWDLAEDLSLNAGTIAGGHKVYLRIFAICSQRL